LIPECCHMLKVTIVCSGEKYFYLTTRYHPLICLWLWPHEDLPATSCPFPRVPAHFPQPACPFPHTRKHKARELAISAPFTDFHAIKADNRYICGDYRWCCSWERGSCDRGVDNRGKSLIIDLYRMIFSSGQLLLYFYSPIWPNILHWYTIFLGWLVVSQI